MQIYFLCETYSCFYNSSEPEPLFFRYYSDFPAVFRVDFLLSDEPPVFFTVHHSHYNAFVFTSHIYPEICLPMNRMQLNTNIVLCSSMLATNTAHSLTFVQDAGKIPSSSSDESLIIVTDHDDSEGCQSNSNIQLIGLHDGPIPSTSTGNLDITSLSSHNSEILCIIDAAKMPPVYGDDKDGDDEDDEDDEDDD